MSRGYDYENEKIRRIAVDADGILKTKPEGVYLAEDPTLGPGAQHRLRLTSDAKLMVDDPTTQAKVDEALAILEDAGFGLEALEALVGAIPTTPELEADADTRYTTLITAIAGITGGVNFTDYHHYVELAGGVTYTPPAKTQAMLCAIGEWYGMNGINIEFYDGSGWMTAAYRNTPSEAVHYLFQDSDQNIRIINDYGSDRKISLTGATWS